MPKKLRDFLDKLSGQTNMVGPGRLELPTSRLSGVRSNHLSYGPLPAAVVGMISLTAVPIICDDLACAGAQHRKRDCAFGVRTHSETVRHPKRKRNIDGGCRMCMHDRDLTDPVFVPRWGYESVAEWPVWMPKKLFDFLDKRSRPLNKSLSLERR